MASARSIIFQWIFTAIFTVIPFQGREFVLNFLAIFLDVVVKNAFFPHFFCSKTHLVAVILPLCYTNTNNKVGTKRQNC